MSTNVPTPSRVIQVASSIVDDLVRWGPASKTGFCGRMAPGFNAYPYFDSALHYARRNLLGPVGKPIVYSHNLDQYGFPEDLVDVEVYILRFNAQYLATRAETMAEQARLAQLQHGASADLSMFENIASAFSFSMQTLSDVFRASPRVQRGAQATGASAKVYLESV